MQTITAITSAATSHLPNRPNRGVRCWMTICGGAAVGAPELATTTGRTSSWAMWVLLNLVLAMLWRCDSVVILGQLGPRTNRWCGKKEWESGTWGEGEVPLVA